MALPFGLLVSATRYHHRLSLRRAAAEIGIPFTTLAALESFTYPPSPLLAERLARFFYIYPPPEILLPSQGFFDDRTIRAMIRNEMMFHQLIPFFSDCYHSLTSAHHVGTLFLAIRDIYLSQSGGKVSVSALQDTAMNYLLGFGLKKWWDSRKKQEEYQVEFIPFSFPNEVATFILSGGQGVYRVFFPEKEGHPCHLPFLFFYILLKRMVISWTPSIAKRAAESVPLARGVLESNRIGGFLEVREALEFLRRCGNPDLVIGDAFVLHGPVGIGEDVTLITSTVADPAAHWIILKGDLLAELAPQDRPPETG